MANTDTPPPLFPLGGLAPSLKDRVGAVRDAFEAKYGFAPSFVARAPGRVNLIGEHVDYSGYAVLPMAIEQVRTER